MNKEKLKIFFAAFITLLFGPGTGHLLLKQWKKAVFFIVLSIGLFLILGINFISELGTDTVTSLLTLPPTDRFEKISDFYSNFQSINSKMMLFFDICFAALWAYSIVDIFVSARRNNSEEQEKGQEK